MNARACAATQHCCRLPTPARAGEGRNCRDSIPHLPHVIPHGARGTAACLFACESGRQRLYYLRSAYVVTSERLLPAAGNVRKPYALARR